MSEAAWATATTAEELLQLYPPGSVSGRKLRLFACQCARSLLPWGQYAACHDAVTVAEQMAEGAAGDVVVKDAFDRVDFLNHTLANSDWCIAAAAWSALLPNPHRAAVQTHDRVIDFEVEVGSRYPEWSLGLARDVFGNPFRPIDFTPWRTDTAVALARQMYESREFAAMPILADALQDAGCDNHEVLNHCRGGGPHVRGCWVVDSVLGKQ